MADLLWGSLDCKDIMTIQIVDWIEILLFLLSAALTVIIRNYDNFESRKVGTINTCVMKLYDYWIKKRWSKKKKVVAVETQLKNHALQIIIYEDADKNDGVLGRQ